MRVGEALCSLAQVCSAPVSRVSLRVGPPKEQTEIKEIVMADRLQRTKGGSEQMAGKVKRKAGETSGRPTTAARGAAKEVKGKAKNATGKARSAVKKATR